MKFEERILQEEFQLNDTDDIIIDYIRKHRGDINQIAIQKIAKELYIVPNAIMRLCRKLGYSGFAELKMLLKQEENVEDELPSLLSDSLIKTLDLVDSKKIELVASKMLATKNIHFIGVGESLYFCQMMVDNLKCVNQSAYCYETYREIEYRLQRCNNHDLVVVITASGMNTKLNNWIKYSKERGAYIVSITHFSKNDTSKIANVPLYFWGEDFKLNGYNITDRTGMMLLLRELSEVFWRIQGV